MTTDEEIAKLKEEVASLREELQKRKDEEHQRFLEFRGIDTEYGGAVVCKACSGSGVKAYGSTSTWRGGMSGQQITSGVCDQCWGSGDINRPWVNLKLVRLIK